MKNNCRLDGWVRGKHFINFKLALGRWAGGHIAVLDLKNESNKRQVKTPADTNKSIGLRASYVVSQ